MKSNKSISRFFFTKFHFLQFQKWPKINFWTEKCLKLSKMQFHKKMDLLDFASFFAWTFFLAHCVMDRVFKSRVLEVALSNGMNTSWTRLFYVVFCQIFDHFSKWSKPKVLQSFEKSSKLAKIRKKWTKALFYLSSIHFSHWLLSAKTRLQRPWSITIINTI